MTGFRVVCGAPNGLAFTSPHEVLRARDADEARECLARAERAGRSGAWIAGYLSYELGAAFVRQPVRETQWPLLALGVFDEPSEAAPPSTTAIPALALFAEEPYDAYARAIAAIRASIYDGNVYQVNYTVPFALLSSFDPYECWNAVAQTTQARYQAFVEDDTRCILSWSPELFLSLDGNRIETRPMKGTAPLDAIEELASEKNRAEHVMIVDLLRNDLYRICVDVDVERRFEIERYPTLATMTSTIAGRLREGISLREIFEAMFPCGSITGAPKRSAFAHIARLEPRARNAYCGAIGFLSPQRRGWWNVAIRTAQIEPSGMRFDTGGGIVADSDTRSEWNELHVKAAFLRNNTPSIEVLETFASDARDDRIERHANRLLQTLLRFGVVIDPETVTRTLREARGEAGALVSVRANLQGDLTTRSRPLDRHDDVVPICISNQRVRSSDAFLSVKTSHRPAHEAAAREAAERGCFEAVLRNERGELTEGARTNLFIDVDGGLLTPPVRCGLLPGILRAILVSEGRARERVLEACDLERADAIYVGNSARGLMRARLVKDAV